MNAAATENSASHAAPAPAAARTPFEVAAVRADFPGLAQTVRGHPLVYLDNGATTQKPQCVIDAVVRAYTEDCANVHRGVHALAERATLAYERARAAIRRYIGAREDAEIVFTRGTTEAINLVASGLGRLLAPGDEIVLTEMEHHSNIVPWQRLRDERGLVLRVVPITDDGALDRDAFRQALGARTKLVAITHVSNALGTINPVAALVAEAHAAGAWVLVDGAQALGHQRVDVAALDADFYAFSGHKMFGPTGIGVLYGKRERLEALPPYQLGGDMILSVTFARTRYADLPARLEAGTPNVAGTLGLAAAVAYLDALDWPAVQAHEADVLTYATESLGAIEGIRLLGSAAEKAGVLSFALAGVHPHDLGTVLDSAGVAIRTGHLCAQPLVDHFGVPAFARASFALYNTRAEVDALIAGIHEVQELFR